MRWSTGSSRLTLIPADLAVARRWGEITGRALAAGRPLPANDAWIAACCLTHGAGLATLNVRDFARIDGLRLITPQCDGFSARKRPAHRRRR